MPEQPPDTAEPSPEAVAVLGKYAWGAVKNYQQHYGTLADREEVAQEIQKEWIDAVRPTPESYEKLLQPDSTESAILRKTAKDVLSRTRDQRKRLKRQVRLDEQAGANKLVLSQLIDLQLGFEEALQRLTPDVRTVVAARVLGKTFDEIGRELNMPRQKAFRLYQSAQDILKQCLLDLEGGE